MKVEYNSPPISEVAFSVFFKPLKNIKVPHIGLFWSAIKDEYPHCDHMPPATYGRIPIEELNLLVPQCSFAALDYEYTIQVQGNAFLFFWNKSSKKPEYPSFEKVFHQFKVRLNQFNEFLKLNEIGQIEAEEYLLEYKNEIEAVSSELKDPSKIGDLIPEWKWGRSELGTMEKPFAVMWNSLYSLGSEKGVLHVSVRNDVRSLDKADVIVLEINASSEATVKEDMKDFDAWFSHAHEKCNAAFNELTSNQIQSSAWGRQS